MALSNILNEPRREITETVVGILLFALVLVPDYYVARWFQRVTDTRVPIEFDMFFCLIGLVMAFVAGVLVLKLIHGAGELACEFLDEVCGIRLRPKRR